MAWFKFGKQDARTQHDAPAVSLETVETMRTRAKRRLMGALVLVITAVVGFPLLFETQPRPALVDVPIEIPDKTSVKPLTVPPALNSRSVPATAAKVDDKSSLGGQEEIVTSGAILPSIAPNSNPKSALAAANTAVSATKSIVPTPSAPTERSVADKAAADQAAADKASAEAAVAKQAALKAAQDKAAQSKVAANRAAVEKAKSDVAKSDAAKAQALLDGKATRSKAPDAAAESASGERFIVQFGSFADEAKAREVRQKVERAGLKTYAQIADTSQGKRHRARVGPFATRAEAEKAASKIKSLDLPANILTL
jgi:DedD protein